MNYLILLFTLLPILGTAQLIDSITLHNLPIGQGDTTKKGIERCFRAENPKEQIFKNKHYQLELTDGGDYQYYILYETKLANTRKVMPNFSFGRYEQKGDTILLNSWLHPDKDTSDAQQFIVNKLQMGYVSFNMRLYSFANNDFKIPPKITKHFFFVDSISIRTTIETLFYHVDSFSYAPLFMVNKDEYQHYRRLGDFIISIDANTLSFKKHLIHFNDFPLVLQQKDSTPTLVGQYVQHEQGKTIVRSKKMTLQEATTLDKQQKKRYVPCDLRHLSNPHLRVVSSYSLLCLPFLL